MSSPMPSRARLFESLLPDGPPVLWCPPLTHYDHDGAIDVPRIRAHLRYLSPHVKGLLVPGSTGDGWELTGAEVRQLLKTTLDEAPALGMRVLVGTLSTGAQQTLELLSGARAWLQSRTGEANQIRALTESRVCGFTVCAPRGKDLTQEELGQALTAFLETGLPLAVYQLPQVTQNEIDADLASALASRFENFLCFKDSSGADLVALSGKLLGIFTVRGAEGDYGKWLKLAGGPYDGFLLASANCFAPQLSGLIEDLAARRLERVQRISERLTTVIDDAFRLVGELPHGNAFANANKALDHYFAHGPRAATVTPPRLHAGISLPVEVIRATGDLLNRHGCMPRKGYLE